MPKDVGYGSGKKGSMQTYKSTAGGSVTMAMPKKKPAGKVVYGSDMKSKKV